MNAPSSEEILKVFDINEEQVDQLDPDIKHLLNGELSFYERARRVEAEHLRITNALPEITGHAYGAADSTKAYDATTVMNTVDSLYRSSVERQRERTKECVDFILKCDLRQQVMSITSAYEIANMKDQARAYRFLQSMNEHTPLGLVKLQMTLVRGIEQQSLTDLIHEIDNRSRLHRHWLYFSAFTFGQLKGLKERWEDKVK